MDTRRGVMFLLFCIVGGAALGILNRENPMTQRTITFEIRVNVVPLDDLPDDERPLTPRDTAEAISLVATDALSRLLAPDEVVRSIEHHETPRR